MVIEINADFDAIWEDAVKLFARIPELHNGLSKKAAVEKFPDCYKLAYKLHALRDDLENEAEAYFVKKSR